MKLANALQMTLNDFFCDSLEASCGVFEKQIEQILKDCTASETRFIAKMLTDMKEALREYERSTRRTI